MLNFRLPFPPGIVFQAILNPDRGLITDNKIKNGLLQAKRVVAFRVMKQLTGEPNWNISAKFLKRCLLFSKLIHFDLFGCFRERNLLSPNLHAVIGFTKLLADLSLALSTTYLPLW